MASDREAQLKAAIAALDDWFDSVQIFATWRENGETFSASIGAGNSFATSGLLRGLLDGGGLEEADDDSPDSPIPHG